MASPLEQFTIKPIVSINIGGLNLSYTNSALYMTIAVLVIVLGLVWLTSRRDLVPGRGQSFAESIYEFIATLIRDNAGEEAMRYFPLIFSVFVWAPTVILYATGQYHVSDVIVRAKWRMLTQVQTKIETLYTGKKIPNRETLEQLEKLMNYHDRIKSTPNSALNFRASLNFLNSLLLPVLAFVATNIPGIVELFQGKTPPPTP